MAVKSKMAARRHFSNVAGMYFWQRAPRYMPHMPPSPTSRPMRQSGATATPGYKGASKK